MSTTIEGLEELRREVKKLSKRYPEAMAGALYKLGVAILSDSLPRVPIEFGVLRASGYVAPPVGVGEDATCEVGYGTVYAIPQHERLDYRHPRGGEAKYLEKAIGSVVPRALPLLAKWCVEIAARNGKWSVGSTPTRPTISNSNRKTEAQGRRLARARANVRKRTGR